MTQLVPSSGIAQPTLESLQQDIKNIMDQLNISDVTNPRVRLSVNNLIVNDGTQDIILIGYQSGGF